MAVGPYALTSLANLKEYLGITGTGSDALLEKCIDRATARIEVYCGRKLKARNFAEWRNGCGSEEIRLYQYPVQSVTNVWTGNYSALVISALTQNYIRASVGVNQETDNPSLTLTATADDGTTVTDTIKFSITPTTADLEIQIKNTPPFTCSLGKNLRCVQLRPRAGADAILQTVTLFAADTASEYTYDFDTGRLTIDASWWANWPLEKGLMPNAAKSVLIEYRGGYETIPADMEQCCIEVAAMVFRDRVRDKSLVTERLGDYSYSRAAPAGEVMGSSILAIMEEYLLEYREFA
jgi:hypothetical protein